MSVHQLKDGRWIVQFAKGTVPDQPNKKREYFGRGIEAENKARQRNIELGLGKIAHGSGKSFSKLAAYYIESKFDKIEHSSILTADIHLVSHLIPFFGITDALHITHEMVDAYVSQRRSSTWKHGGKLGETKTGVSRSTVKRELTTLQSVLNFAVRRGQILYNPVQHFENPKEDDAVIQPATSGELSAIIRHAAPHLQRFIILAYYTACRPGSVEALSVRWDQIDFTGKVVFIKSAKKGGLKARSVSMHEELENYLLQWYVQDAALKPFPEHVCHYEGRQIKSIRKAWNTAKKRAKVLRRLRPYDIRHAAITAMLEAGSDLKAVSLTAGHSSPAMTMRKYQHVSNQLQKDAVNTLGMIGDGKKR